MFDLITGKAQHLPSRAGLPIVLSTTVQVVAVATVLVVPALFVADQIPEIPTMMAFVAPPPPPPAPPPPAPRPAAAKPIPAARPIPATSELAAPVDVPRTIEPEPAAAEGLDEGVPGGVEGGIPGGVVGGVVGGIPDIPAPPPPPPQRGPIRTGGQIETPALLHRVEPYYPPMAVAARLEGMVILEAIIGRDGTVAEVKVLRSAGVLLDREALLAVRQWRFKPLLLNGQREEFILTVTLSFHLENAS